MCKKGEKFMQKPPCIGIWSKECKYTIEADIHLSSLPRKRASLFYSLFSNKVKKPSSCERGMGMSHKKATPHSLSPVVQALINFKVQSFGPMVDQKYKEASIRLHIRFEIGRWD